MNSHAIIALATTFGVFVALQLRRRTPTDLLFIGALVVVTLCNVITPQEALAGFSSNAILTIAGLLVCAAGLRSTGVLDWLGERLLGGVSDERGALRRLGATLVAASAFVLNTAVVSMMMPVVIDWCRKRDIAPSRMLIPLSYFVILGGVCTLIGTSTMLVVNGELQAQYGSRLAAIEDAAAAAAGEVEFAEKIRPMRLFEISWVGVPCAIVGSIVLYFVAPLVLPDRREVVHSFGEQQREYLVELDVRPNCPMVGRTVESAGLRHLKGLFLIEIDRDQGVVTPVSPDEIISQGDRLVFTGVVDTIVDLEKIPGLVPAADSSYETDPVARQRRHLTEVVLSRSSPLVGSTVRDGSFRQRYGAAVVAVHRNGVRVTNKIGNIILEPGDTLLLQTRGAFESVYRDSRDFYLVSDVKASSARRHERAAWAAFLALLLIIWLSLTSFAQTQGVSAGFTSTAIAALAVACLMMLSGCLTVPQARAALDVPMLLTIAGALGLAKALEKSGAAAAIANGLVSLVGDHPWGLLIVTYLVTSLFTELITNTAVAATFLPIAIAVAEQSGHHPRPFIMAIALAASLSFVTPIGYQTNLMVMGPGGYYPRDYMRAGLLVTASVAITALLLIPQIWPF